MRIRKNQIKKRNALQDISVDVNIQKKHARNNVKEPLKNLKVASLDEKENRKQKTENNTVITKSYIFPSKRQYT